jgi:hypothetical protein
MAKRKVVPFDEFYYQLKLMHLFQKHPVYSKICHISVSIDLIKLAIGYKCLHICVMAMAV